MKHHDGSYRNTREAFAADRVGSISGPYRAPRLARWWPTISAAITLIALAGCGVLLAWRG